MGSDPGAKDLARVLRVPGTLNYKYDPARPVTVVYHDPELCTLQMLESMLPTEETKTNRGLLLQSSANLQSTDNERPGDIFAQKTTWREILEPHEWHFLYNHDGVDHWQRPGKDGQDGASATVGYKELDILYVFSSNAQPFEPDKGYSKFTAYTLLNHKGDFTQAAKTLAGHNNGHEPQSESLEWDDPDLSQEAPDDVEQSKAELFRDVTPLADAFQPESTPDATAQPQVGAAATPKQKRQRIVVHKAAEALQPQPDIEFIVDKLVTAGSLGVWYGEPGAKKTYSLCVMAVCVSMGLDYLGFKTKQMPVLIVDEESGVTRLSRRLGEVMRGLGADENTPLYYISLAGFKMDDKNDPVILQSYIEVLGIGLVIMDALADVMGGDENSKEDTQPVFNALRKICDRTGAAIQTIHHSNKRGSYRGSSAIKGSIDLLVKVESEDGANVVYYVSEKNRDAEPARWAAVATWLPSEKSFTLKPWVDAKGHKYNDGENFVTKFLTDNGISSTSIIESCVDSCSANAARKALYSLTKLGLVYRTNKGGQGVEALWDLVQDENSPV